MSDELNNQAAPNLGNEPAEDEFPMPPATFDWFVISLSMQAEMYLGRLRTGDEPPKINLTAAQHYIDLLALMQEKTKGNLTVEEQRLVENTLTELRFRYVAAVEEKRKTQSA